MTYKTGAKNLITDVAGLKVGNASDAVLKSGSTVLVGDAPFTASVHVMGGGPGTRETDLLAPDKTVQQVDALVLSGGSAFGLDACAGVAGAWVSVGCLARWHDRWRFGGGECLGQCHDAGGSPFLGRSV